MEALEPGIHFISGNEACARGAILAGCRFYAGYPITPSSEIMECLARLMPKVDGICVQMEDEIASITAVLGASWAGVKSMTATSGPGFSLMMEGIGLGVMTETPCVVVNVMRAGPSTGIPTRVGQGDVMQARWGSHGVYEVICLAPWSPQEMLDMTIKAFNLSEKFRVPTILLADEVVGHMYENVEIPEAEKVKVVERKKPRIGEPYLPFKAEEDLIPPMASAGEGYRFHVTGLTHDERGYPSSEPEIHEWLVSRLVEKIRRNASQIADWEEHGVEDAEIVIIAYGSNARSAFEARNLAEREGLKVGLLRLKTLNPLPEQRIREISERVRAILVAEVNYGQIVFEVQRLSAGCKVYLLPKMGGELHHPEEILEKIRFLHEKTRGEKRNFTSTMLEIFKPKPLVREPQPLTVKVRHPCDSLLRVERLPHMFCPGCGLGIVLASFIRALKKSRLNPDLVCAVSGIGCTGRISGYLNLDSFHVTHGRALAFAAGLKLAKPQLEVVVFGGDGDLFAIGGNHFIHAARRNLDLLVICVNNFNYGQTGGQAAPTTPLNAKTTTTPYGNREPPFNLPLFAASVGASYVARWTVYHSAQLEKSIFECLGGKGFRFIEVVSPCPTNFGKLNRLNGVSLMKHFKTKVKVEDGADPREVGIPSPTQPFIVGTFIKGGS